MLSLRNSGADVDELSMSDRLLVAARETILAVGWKRTTLTDIARAAGVSRMTVYRTYADMPTLFADLMTREWAEVVAAVASADDAAAGWPERIASRLAGTVAALRENQLLRRMIDVDPEWLLPYLLERRGRSQDAVLDLLAERIAEAQSAGAVRDEDPVVLARAIVLAAHGFLFSAHTMADDTVTIDELDEQFAELVQRFLAP